MSIDSNNNVQGIGSTTQGSVDSPDAPGTGSFWAQLRPAAYRGVPFGVWNAQGRFGRRNAVHEYPFRDTPWIEDLGRSARRFQVAGFVVGDDVIAQRAKMIAAVEAAGDGELVHPTYGRLKVALMDFTVDEDWEHGRVFRYTFTFIKQGQRLYPGGPPSGQDAIGDAVQTLNAGTAGAFATKALPQLANGAAVINQAAKQASSLATQANAVANDATSLVKLAVTLPGQFGRLLGIATGVNVQAIASPAQELVVADLVAIAAKSRAAVAAAASALIAAGSNLSPTTMGTFTTAAQTLMDSILAASSTPGDALRNLGALANFQPSGAAAGAALVVQGAAADAFRRAALASMANASATYEPSSNDDAIAARNQVLDVLDAEITTAGDQAEDSVFSALRSLRAQVVQDLNARGASLPALRVVKTAQALPSLTLAQRLYRDATRADELVQRANPIHPAFMPLTFTALSS